MWLNAVIVNCSSVKLHFLSEWIWNNAHDVFLIFGRPFPIIFVSLETDKLIRLPFGEPKRSGAYWIPIELAVADSKFFRIGFPADCFLLQCLCTEKMLR